MVKKLKTPIYVTKPWLPPLKEFTVYMKRSWNSKCLTNNGPFHQELEESLCLYLGVKYISLFSNGTLALVTALQSLHITGEVITTPYSFVATTHALWWNNIKPVFVDIDPKTLNLDPNLIEAAITPKTTAILPVHVYGNPCDVYKIKQIADVYGLKVIYDGCHTFGTKINDMPVLNFGELSIMSFHATKVFTTFEGGAIVCHDFETKKRIDNLKNFGFVDETTVVLPGINAKMNEIQSAMGLLQLKYIDGLIKRGKQIALHYRQCLTNIEGLTLLEELPHISYSYSYFPIFIDMEKYGKSRDEVYEELKNNNIYCRRYFFPLISQFPTYSGLDSAQKGKMPVAEGVTENVICLPFYPTLNYKTVDYICDILKK